MIEPAPGALSTMDARPGPAPFFWSEVREKVDLFRFRVMAEPICGICGKPLDKRTAEIDHIIPLSKGGGHVWGNLQLAHPSCNRMKGDSMQRVVYSI